MGWVAFVRCNRHRHIRVQELHRRNRMLLVQPRLSLDRLYFGGKALNIPIQVVVNVRSPPDTLIVREQGACGQGRGLRKQAKQARNSAEGPSRQATATATRELQLQPYTQESRTRFNEQSVLDRPRFAATATAAATRDGPVGAQGHDVERRKRIFGFILL
jgi:hypothetical protein